MKYQQIPIRRLSRAASSLIRDGAWHGFSEDADVHYRVTDQVVQKVRIEPNETTKVLGLFSMFPPLPTRLMSTGFREELCFRDRHGVWVLREQYARPFEDWERLSRMARSFGVGLQRVQEGLLEYSVQLPGFSFNAVQHALILLRSCMALAVEMQRLAREERNMGDQEMAGLLKTLVAMHSEECPPLVKPKKGPHLPSLFDEDLS